ncbi:MAG: RnfH family protein [Pseudomonadota bacterium]
MKKISVTVAWAWPQSSGEINLCVSEGATIDDVIAEARKHNGDKFPHQLLESAVGIGVWARVRKGSTVLCEHDRVELYRPLTADPKDARRRRAAKPSRR